MITKLWAVVDLNWGEPFPIPETFRDNSIDAESAFCKMTEYGIYHGGSEFPFLNGTIGNMKKAQAHGFRVALVDGTEHKS